MRESVVLPAMAVVVNSKLPCSLRVPAKTVSPAFFSTGMLSPVMGAWFTEEEPSVTVPSRGTFSPGRTRTVLPTGTLWMSTDFHEPSS